MPPWRFLFVENDRKTQLKQEEKGATGDEMLGWHHRLNGHECEQAPGAGDGRGGPACCGLWGHRESDATEQQQQTASSKNANDWVLVTNTGLALAGCSWASLLLSLLLRPSSSESEQSMVLAIVCDQPSTHHPVSFTQRTLILVWDSFTSHVVEVTWRHPRLTPGVQGTAFPDHCSHDVTRLSPNQQQWPAGHEVPITKPCIPDSCPDQRWSGFCPMEGAPTGARHHASHTFTIR